MPGVLLHLTKQWIAGETAEEAVERVRDANASGILGLLNLLGEHTKSKHQVEETLTEYLRLLELIQESGVKSQISIKPSQLGINLDFDYCVSNYLKMTEACRSHSDNWLWVDMENSLYTQKTIDLYTKILQTYPNTGVAIQAYLKRSENDLKFLLPLDAKIRLVKGAYNEPLEIALKKKRLVTDNYERLLEILFSHDNFFAVATHDSALINKSKELKKIHKADFEYEMLMGVRDKLKSDLVAQGYRVREYVPYGPQWLPYSIRRIREKKSNILLLGRSIFTR